jgi:hypothetical protein
MEQEYAHHQYFKERCVMQGEDEMMDARNTALALYQS